MATVKASETQTAVISTEHTLLDTADAGTYVLHVDTTNLANGDEVEIRVYKAVLSGDAAADQLFYLEYVLNVQTLVGKSSTAVVAPHGAKFTLKQTAGTGRSFKWSVDTP